MLWFTLEFCAAPQVLDYNRLLTFPALSRQNENLSPKKRATLGLLSQELLTKANQSGPSIDGNYAHSPEVIEKTTKYAALNEDENGGITFWW